MQPQLLRHQTKDDNGTHNSADIALIHRSCNQLLDVLAIGACPLANLEEVLSQHSPSPVGGRDDQKDEKTNGENKKCENVIRDSIKGCSCQWVRILERLKMAELLMTSPQHATEHQEEEGEDTASIYGQNFGAAATLNSWFPYTRILKGGGSEIGGGVSAGGPAPVTSQRVINTRISATQPNIAPSLLQVSVASILVQIHKLHNVVVVTSSVQLQYGCQEQYNVRIHVHSLAKLE